jgi:hypothetical protein
VALVCNIDQRGRQYRYRIGVALLALGVALGVGLLLVAPLEWALVGGGLPVAGGLFSLFEARRGWCVARAMGFKTRV